jgi:RNA polymerase sigma factor (sigma-70 family)
MNGVSHALAERGTDSTLAVSTLALAHNTSTGDASYDLTVLRRCVLDGDSAATAPLVNRLQPMIMRFLGRRLPKAALEDIEDYAQETIWRCWLRLSECRAQDDGALCAWALTIAWRIVIADRHRRLVTVPLAQADVVAVGSAENQLQVPSLDIPSLAELLGRIACNAQLRLTPATQELLYVRLIEGARWKDIAVRYQTSLTAVRRRYQRAQATLRRSVITDLHDVPEPVRSCAIIWLSDVARARRSP